MREGIRNIQALSIIALTSILFLGWQNCSQVGFQNVNDPLVYKINANDGLAVLDPDQAPQSSDQGDTGSVSVPMGEGEEEPQNEEPVIIVGHGCGIDVVDIMVNVEYLSAHRDEQGAVLPLQSVTGLLSLKSLVESGLQVTALGKLNVNQIRLQLHDEGNYILAADGAKHPLAVIASQRKPGIRIRLEGANVSKDQALTLRLNELPIPRKFAANQCRLDNNLSGDLK